MYKKMKEDRRGFTLVELIVVIAILGVLMAILVPQYIQYVERTRKAVCESNREELRRMIELDMTASEADGGASDAGAAEKEFNKLTGSGGAYSGEKTICPDGGKIEFFTSNGTYSFTCTKHGESITDKISSALANVNFGNISRTLKNKTSQTISEYLDSDKKVIDSGASDVGNGADISFTKAIKDQLGTTFSSNYSWRLKKESENYVIYVSTAGTITDKEVGNKVNVVKYTYDNNGKIVSRESGICQVTKISNVTPNYNALDSSSYKKTS